MNKVILIGHLGADPELRYTQNQEAVLRIRLATSESFVGRDGVRRTRTEWHSVQVWGKRAEGLNTFLKKGRRICVEGRLQHRSWEDQATRTKRFATDIVARDVLVLDGAPRDEQRDAEERSGGSYDRTTPAGGERDDEPPDDPDIPF